ncbi:MAG: ATP-binding cassette protein [Hydrocarboniphaga sp.]|uniref:ABC transporter ATP-binding protein n=1 Tax=Hydrocarboniphaga sp. TaxID=2033016 RepID=UPI002603E71D|nr:ABC transporter ATP-binding protein [Hydrocarboniphaga sp.]MDB5973174.1 ATP-binding cassette protein [Hydrocarboniphaga sp.]
MTTAPLLSVEQLCVAHRTPRGDVEVVSGINLQLEAGGTLAIVGESGSGKSQTALAIMGLNGPSACLTGRVLFDGENLLTASPARRRALRGARIAMVFQDPMASLNPYLRIGLQLAEVLETHRGASRSAAWAEAARTLDSVRVSAARERLNQYPHELSGGMRQRVMIAMAIIAGPQLLIADEPTTALDPTVQAQILALLDELRRDRGLAILLITHDLGVVSRLCEQTLVMYAGKLVESAPTQQLLSRPRHPYTAALLRARPSMQHPPGLRLDALPGQPPDLRQTMPACRFAPRCRYAQPDCADVPLQFERGVLCRHPL